MQLDLKRIFFTDKCTVGELRVDGVFICHILEDTDRGLTAGSKPSDKKYGETAIPIGTYEIIFNYSDSFKKILPLLLNVPLYMGIRIHSGNSAVDTKGCLLPGT